MRAVNLIPAEQRRGAGGASGRSDGAVFVILGLLGCLVLLAAVYAVSHAQVSDRRSEAARISAQAQSAQAQAATLAPYTAFLSLRDQRVSTVQQLAGTRFDWAHAFHELGRVLPADVSLSGVHGSIAGAATAAAAPGPATTAGPPGSAASSTPPGATPSLSISGCTVSQSEVAFTLTRLRLMDGVATVDLHSSAEATSAASASSGTQSCPVGFQVTVTFNALPPVSTPTPSTAAPATAPAVAAAPGAAPSAAPVAATTGAK